MHMCVELHNIDFMRLVLAKNAERGADLLTQRNKKGLTPSELLTKEFEKAELCITP